MSNAVYYSRQEVDLPSAWANAFLESIKRAGREFAPFTVSIASPEGLTVPDSLAHPMVQALDACLDHDGHQTVEKVAFTIFPERVWKLCKCDRHELYREYRADLPTYVKWEPRKNQGGLYFGRMIAFGINHKTGRPLECYASRTLAEEGNQLEHIIKQCKKSVERGRTVARMQLQAAIFDPFRDLTTAGQPSFPCLQHITFDPEVKSRGLALNAFYATQQLYVKGYGNWLGLCRLGAFVAQQAGLKLTRFTCFAGVQKMDIAPTRSQLRTDLIRSAKATLADVESDKLAVVENGC